MSSIPEIPQRREDIISLSVPITSLYRPAADPDSRDLVILLHGFQDTAESFDRRVFRDDVPAFHALTPNAPFPAPIRNKDDWRAGFSWFFADRSKGLILLHPSVGVEAVVQIVERRGFADHRKILVGFSQGGYVAPFVAKRLKNVVKIIGVGSGYRVADYEGVAVDDVDAIHGDLDEIVEIERSKHGFNELRPKLRAGEYFTLPGLKHGVDGRARELIKKRIVEKFAEAR